jgi:Uma2 family endonuclease
MVIRERPYTAQEFWELARSPQYAEQRIELDNGRLVEMAPSRPINTIIAGRIITFLNIHILKTDSGYVTVPDGGFKLADDIVRQPDVAYISKARQPNIPDEFEVAPDLAVEIVSPREDVLKKVYEYLRAGTQIVWAVYADDQTVHVFRLADSGQLIGDTLGIDDTLDGGDVLPDFRLQVRDIFPNS